MKPYHEYTNWMLRQYFSHEQDFAPVSAQNTGDFAQHALSVSKQIARSKAEELNLATTAIVVGSLPSDSVRILREVFGGSELSVPVSVRCCAKSLSIKERAVWSCIRLASNQIASVRGLI